jgi:hypothetical protein
MSTIRPLPDPSTLRTLHDGRGALGFHLRLPLKTTTRELLTGQGILAPLEACVGLPGRLGDVVHTFQAAVYLVSPRLCATLEEIGATGWTATPVKIEGLDAAAGYALFGVSGRCGPTIGTNYFASPGQPSGRYLDMATWDGSDVFLAENVNWIFLTPRCAAALSKAKLVNLRLGPTGLEAPPPAGPEVPLQG